MEFLGTEDASGSCNSDGDSLFGEGDAGFDSASLFSDGDDGNGSSSPFMETALLPSPPASCTGSTFVGLTLPAQPSLLLPPRPTLVLPNTPPAAILSPPNGETQSPAYNEAVAPQTASPLVCTETQRPELQLTFPTPPCEGAQAQGQSDVSTHSLTLSDDFHISWDSDLAWPSWADCIEDDLTIDFSLPEPELVRDAQVCPDVLQSQDLILESEPRDAGAHLGAFINVTTGTPAVTSEQPLGNRIPRRVDRPSDDPQCLVEFIPAFSAKTTKDQAVQSLGIRRLHHTALMRELREFFSSPLVLPHKHELESLQQEVMKKAFVRLSLVFLQRSRDGQHCRALEWFGPASLPHRAAKSPVWPEDSSEIVCCVTVLLHQTFKNSKQKARSAITRQKKNKSRKQPAGSPVHNHPAKRHQAHGPAEENRAVICLDPATPVNTLAKEVRTVIYLDCDSE